MADPCEGYNYWLAIEDFIPVVFGAFGFYYLAQRIGDRFPQLKNWAYFAGTILVIGSTFAGSVRKAFLAGDSFACESLDWAQIPFFSAMPIGFAILCWAVLCLLKDRKVSFLPFGITVAVVFALASVMERSLTLIIVGGLFAVATGVECAILAKRQGSISTTVLFALYSVTILMLPALGSNEDRADVGHQWLEQGTNTVAQGLFALAAFYLLRDHQRAGNPSVLVEN